MLPHARSDELVIRELSEETLVYDLKRHRAHCLNRTAARVWSYCDGQTSIQQMADSLRRASGAPGSEELVWLALQQLERRASCERPSPAASGRPAAPGGPA